MKKVLAIVIAAMFVMSITAVSFAQEKAAPAPAAAPAKAAPAKAEKAPKAKTMTVSGEVTAVDAAAKTLTVKGGKKGDVMLMCDDKTKVKGSAKDLSGVVMGAKVKVTYSEMDGKNTAKTIDVAAPAKKAEKKAEKAAPAAAPAKVEKAPAPAAPAAPAAAPAKKGY